ncbi:MAG: hypothetical protein QOE44_602, partial [Solirubrobacteraceae bacterium]|nr:hypothetical protein [Solirubrobacteraceae bacterium]
MRRLKPACALPLTLAILATAPSAPAAAGPTSARQPPPPGPPAGRRVVIAFVALAGPAAALGSLGADPGVRALGLLDATQGDY